MVIASIIGSCPIGLSFTIPIPANLPSASKATFSWTWFNFSGNREMYQNCASESSAARREIRLTLACSRRHLG